MVETKSKIQVNNIDIDSRIHNQYIKRLLVDTSSKSKPNQKLTSSGLQLQDLQATISMRQMWSNRLLGTVIVIVLSNILLMRSLGFKFVSFDNSSIVVGYIIESLLQIFGLGWLVVNYLFTHKE